ncbi:hypothetical protein FB45DRAFT_523299 [Roridomyces roridus]|uniref:polynucleotide adenylyltransferase n=1 Tax=Roridomyces roridus TaxID=1738132 RepID=A0AAD7FN72_9AGAR|nr:hypothetical protein FB45DRAFT_523299 [Roridomyces roridus]
MVTEIPNRRRRRVSSVPPADTPSFADGADFIGFGPDSDVEETDTKADRKGKGRARDERSRSPEPGPLPSQSQDSETRDGHGESRRERGAKRHRLYLEKQQQKESDRMRSRLAPWVEETDWEGCENAAELFHREVLAFVNWISPTPQEDEVRGLVVQIISRAVTAAFPDATVCPFGSYATKLYLPLGDIDLVIRSQAIAYARTDHVLTALAATIKRSGITDRVTIIAKARVPIVKFITSGEYGRFNVDMSLNQENGIAAGNIINGFLKHFGGGTKDCLALRALVLLTKLFLSMRKMNEVYTGGLGSYAIVCLCISFLQMHPKIRHGQIDPDENLGVLVVEFFELYGKWFRYEEVGISLRDGGSYFTKRQRGWGWGESWGSSARRGGLLSIEDPGDPTNDISSGSYNFPSVRGNLAGAYDVLESTIFLRAGILKSRKENNSFRLRDRYDPKDMSILSDVVGVTQETLNNRLLVKEVYDKQTLHRHLGVQPMISPTVSSNGVNGTTKAKSKSKNEGKASASASSSRARTPVVIVVDGAEASGSRTKPNGKANGKAEDHWAEADAEYAVHVHQDKGSGDEGRYGIGLAPPRKRRRTGKYPDDGHAVTYTVDSEDEHDSSSSVAEDREVRAASASGGGKRKGKATRNVDWGVANGRGGMEIKGAATRASPKSKDPDKNGLDGGNGAEEGSGSRPPSRSSSARRDYWLSKGIGSGSPESSP